MLADSIGQVAAVKVDPESSRELAVAQMRAFDVKSLIGGES